MGYVVIPPQKTIPNNTPGFFFFFFKFFIAQVESKLWMMTGEDEPFGSRKIRYDDEAYCMEAHGLLDQKEDWML